LEVLTLTHVVPEILFTKIIRDPDKYLKELDPGSTCLPDRQGPGRRRWEYKIVVEKRD
jgi:hypothetical protein